MQQTLVSLSKCRDDTAEAFVEGGGGGGKAEGGLEQGWPARSIPNPAFRLSTAKILVELGGDAFLEAAGDIIDRLLQEDDTNVEVWYVKGVEEKTAGDIAGATETFEHVLELLATQREIEQQEGAITPEEVEAQEQYVGQVREMLAGLAGMGGGAGGDEEEEEEEEEEEDEAEDMTVA